MKTRTSLAPRAAPAIGYVFGQPVLVFVRTWHLGAPCWWRLRQFAATRNENEALLSQRADTQTVNILAPQIHFSLWDLKGATFGLTSKPV